MAKWIETTEKINYEENKYECSECHHEAICNYEYEINYLTPYCPFCGEKMENPNGQE